MIRWFGRLHRGPNDKYFSLLNTASRSFARLLVNLLIARLGGADNYSSFVLLLTAEVIWTTLLSAGLVTPMLNLAPGLNQSRRDGLGFYTLRRTLGISLVVGLPAAGLWAALGFSGVGLGVALGFVVATLMQGLLVPLRGWRNLSFESWHVFWADALTVGLPIMGVLIGWGGYGEEAVLPIFWWTAAAANVAAGLVMVNADRTRLSRGTPPDRPLRLRLGAIGRPVLLGSIAYSAGSRLQPIVLAIAAVPLEVARFGGAAALVGPLRMLGMALSGVIRPRFGLYYHRREVVRVRRLMVLVCGGVFLLALMMVLAFAVLGDWMGTALFGGWYDGAARVLMLGSIYAGTACVASFLVTGLQVQSDRGPSFVAKVRLGASAFSLALVWPACATYGAEGAIAAMALVELIFVVVAFIRWWRIDERMLADRAGS